jgi:hypothetical protein
VAVAEEVERWAADDRIAAAWKRVVHDCGCPDIYYCPTSDDIECPRHSGFTVCCDRRDKHIAVR